MDTIFALASAPGKAGVAVVRVSGEKAWDVAKALGGRLPEPRFLTLRNLVAADGSFLDQSMVVLFEKGASFTGERVAEFHLHGSVAVVNAVLLEISRIDGTRVAGPGEFTRRALDNGCMDLTQVEALSDLIEAETEAQRKQALKVLSGALSDEISKWREKLVRAAALLEATIDFVDEEVPTDVSPEVQHLISTVLVDLQRQIEGYSAAERVRNGFEVAIVGLPNAGKSTLLNRLAGREAAITSNIAGTTRDVIEVRMDLGGLPVTFLDTAGLRETSDPIEKIGVERALERARNADLRVHLLNSERQSGLEAVEGDIVRFGKSDDGDPVVGVSGLTGVGVSELLQEISDVLLGRFSDGGLSSHLRQFEALVSCRARLTVALDMLASGVLEVDLVSEEIRVGINQLETVIGRVNVEHLLDEIFSSFCVGK